MIICEFEDGRKVALRHAVVDTIVLKEKEILLVKRAARLVEGGKWGLVGGYVDRDETLEQAVRREVLEETGYSVENVEFLWFIDNPNRPNEDRQNIAFVFVCRVAQKTGEADDESEEQQWFPLDALPSKDMLAFDHYDTIQNFLELNR